jgi:hypothetical protein
MLKRKMLARPNDLIEHVVFARGNGRTAEPNRYSRLSIRLVACRPLGITAAAATAYVVANAAELAGEEG